MITNHVWRAPMGSHWKQRRPLLERPCAYAGCGKPITAHAKASMPNGRNRSKS